MTMRISIPTMMKMARSIVQASRSFDMYLMGIQLQNDDDYDKNYQPSNDEDGLVHCVGIKVHQGPSHCNNGTQPIQTGTYHSHGGRDDDVDDIYVIVNL